jgi:hypothetical protein
MGISDISTEVEELSEWEWIYIGLETPSTEVSRELPREEIAIAPAHHHLVSTIVEHEYSSPELRYLLDLIEKKPWLQSWKELKIWCEQSSKIKIPSAILAKIDKYDLLWDDLSCMDQVLGDLIHKIGLPGSSRSDNRHDLVEIKYLILEYGMTRDDFLSLYTSLIFYDEFLEIIFHRETFINSFLII